MSVRNKSIDKARGLLKQLFRTENADLDFGIYRIMNFKRAEIERFIDRDLIEAAESVFKKFARAGAAELEKELERRKKEINDFVPGTIGEDWVVLKNHDLPKVKEFLDVLEEYRAASVSEEQVQDVFNHVYEFFSRYYEDGDFIPRTRYGGRDKYYVPYNGEEVLLHWATKDMYYVKTGEYFNKYSFRAGRFKVTFKLMDAQLEQGNLKGDKKFFILHDKDPVQYNEASNEVEIRFNYRILTDEENEKYGRRTRAKRQEDLIDEALTKIRTSLGLGSISGILHARDDDDRSLMRKHLDAYIQRNTKDFFIHKDLKGFLSKELEFYLVNEVLDLDVLENISESQTKLIMAKAKAIRGISTKIVEFLTQIEEFQKRLFEKKKFVRKTDYCITLDLIPESFYEEIGRNKKQITEWKNLYKLDEITKGTFFSTIGINKFSTEFLKEYKNLVLDTKYFNDDFKNILLSNFTNIDSINGGLLVKSENFHAINLLVHKYENKINCVYLDPPYNTGNDEFLYKDNYQSSSWMSMMNDRFVLLNKLLNLSGIVFTSIDDNELSSLDQLLISIYGKNNKVGRIIILSNPRGRFLEKHMATSHEYVLVYSKDILNLKLTDIPLAERQVNEYKFIDDSGKYRLLGLRKRGAYSRKEDRPNLHFPIYYNKKTNEISLMKKNNDFLEIIPKLSGGEDGVWRWSKEKIMKDINYLIVKKIRNRYDVFQKNYLQEDKRIKARTVWTEKEVNYEKGKEILKDMFGYSPYTYPKPVGLIKKIIDMSTKKNDYIMDYFVGSGTTAHAILELNSSDDGKRKYILIEMAEYFDSVLIPRIKKLLYSKEWKNGMPKSKDGISHFFKYIYLEQYEDTLNNIEFIQSDGSIQSRLDRLPHYFLTYMLDYETKDSPTRISFEQFKTPFNYRIKTISGGEEKEEPVDLVETFNYLLGLHVNRLRAFKDGDRLYRVVYGTRGNEQVVVIWRDTPDIDLKRDKEFIENTVLLDIEPDTVYINGDSYLENAKPIEPEFKRLMGA